MKRSAASDVRITEKTPSARLLDLLIGWAEWVSQEEAANRYCDERVVDRALAADELFALYQEAGGLVCGVDEADTPAERHVVISFLLDRVLPLLLRSRAGKEPAAD